MAILQIRGRKTRFLTMWSGPLVPLTLLWLAGGLPLCGQTQQPDFAKEIQPILVVRCTVCHGSSTQMSGLRLDSREAALKGGDSGKPAIIPGNAATSQIILRVSSEEASRRMPPVGESLIIEDVARLRQWIDQGAEWPAADARTGFGSASAVAVLKDHPHWAFRRLHSVNPPVVKGAAWVKTPVDRFILAALEAKGLRPNLTAPRQELIRRLFFDLIGLPPLAAEIDAFVGDTSPNAIEQVVDRLLASPHFGERWGRHWLDAARYKERYSAWDRVRSLT